MDRASYDLLFKGDKTRWEFSKVSDNKISYKNQERESLEIEEPEDGDLYGTEEELYAGILNKLEKEYLEERFSLCLEIRKGDSVMYEFPKVACPELFIRQLRIKKI